MHHLRRFLFGTPRTVDRTVAWPLLTHGNAKTYNMHTAYTHTRWQACTSTPCSGVSQTAKTAKGRLCSPVVETYIHLRISILHFPFPPHTMPILLIWLWILKIHVFYILFVHYDHLCGLVVRVSGYRYRGLGFDSRRYQIFWVVVGRERGPLSLVRSTEELLE